MTPIRMRAHAAILLCALAAALLSAGLLPAYAQAALLQTVALKVYPQSTVAWQTFGSAVARDGTTVLVGAPYGETASVYVPSISVPSMLSRQATLVPTGGMYGDMFGRAVALSGDTAVIGAPQTWRSGKGNIGVVHIFVRSGTTWSLQRTLEASDPSSNSYFGMSVSIDGNTVVVGAPLDPAGGSGRGSAYVFVRSGTTWSQQAKLTPSDPANGDQFGSSVGVSGDWIAVGSPEAEPSDRGACYVFKRSGIAWSQSAKLVDSLGTNYDRFGKAVAISGTTIVVGTPNDDAGPGPQTGSASIFTRSSTGTWPQYRITAPDRATGDQFGSSVDIDGDTVVIGAEGDDDQGTDAGSAYTYTRNYAGMWSLRRKTVASDGAAGDRFGRSVAVSNNRAVFGAPFDDDKGEDVGCAYYRTVNSAPTAAADSYTTPQGVALVVAAPGVLANDSDPDGDAITAFLVTQPANGTLSFTAGGGFTYTPKAGFAGSDAFTYRAYDNALFSSVVKVTITVPDTTKPTVTHSATYANYLTKVTITGDDGGGLGVKHIEYKVDGGSTKTVAGAAATLELKVFGAHTLEYRAQDKAGNNSAWKKVTVYVKRGTTLSITAPETCEYRSAKLYGYLKYYTTSGVKKPMKGKTVSIQQYKSGKWETIAKVTTSDTGKWAYTAKPSKKATYRVRYAGSNTYVAKTSAKKTVLPKVYLGTPSGPTSLKVNTSLTVRGALKPRHTAGTKPVRIQAYRYESGTWVLKMTYYASVYDYDTYSRYKATIKLTSKGKWRIRAYYPTSSTNYKTYSSYRYITAY